MTFKPTKDHLAEVREVEKYVKKWKPRLWWLRNWDITVVPIPDDMEPEAYIRIACASYIQTGRIEVRQGLSSNATLIEFLGDEFSVELVTVHELCHVLLDDLYSLFMNWVENDIGLPQAAMSSYRDLDEKAVWNMSRTLLAMDRG